MTAAFLSKAFGERLDITLVESGKVGTIGVGEATFSDIRHFFEFLGLREEEWMPACNATYKLAVRFQDWREPGHHFYHPFEQMRSVDGFSLTDWWLKLRPSERFDRDCFVMASLCDAERSPRMLGGAMLDQGYDPSGEFRGLTMSEHQGKTQFPYAYHFEAALLADYLTGYAVDRGVRHVVDDVVDVALDGRGWIDHVRTQENGELRGDLYVDCTGFRGLLVNKALGEPFESWQRFLPNDRAVALQVPLDMAEHGIRPCTTATAQDAGWIWTIPLYGRIGTGYVYSSEYTSPEEAEETLRRFVGPSAAEVPANHIRMRIGRTRNPWVNNCVAIGLSSGFVEPLESTGIFFIHHAVEQLVRHFPGDGFDPVRRDLYNKSVENVMLGVREFLALHYRAAGRSDTRYWRDAKTRELPDGLAERLARWQVQLPDSETIFPYYHGLPPYSYMCILLGMGGVDLAPSAALDLASEDEALREFDRIRARADAFVRELPDQHEYFTALRA
ncbi:tryptophan 7-halogenase [Actinokineospora sp. PR83]|nr:tryptophan 7-halogenase [Actinokineospora sp. PR83]